MNQSLEKALNYLTTSSNIDEVSLEDLESLCRQHPYFTVGQFLLAKKMKHSKNENFIPQVQKTALYFSNPYWLHYQLLNETPTAILPVEADEKTEIEDSTIEEQTLSTSTQTLSEHVLITTEFTKQELEEAGELAHQNLAEEEQVVRAETGDVPITVVYSKVELDDASNLAHTVLAEPETEDDSKSEDSHISQPEIEVSPDLTTEDISEFKIPAVSQPEEESAAISREPDESVEQFLEEIQQEQSAEETLPEQPEKDSIQTEQTGNTDFQLALPEPEDTVVALIPEHIEEQKEETVIQPNNYKEVTQLLYEKSDEHDQMFQSIKAMLDASTGEISTNESGETVVPIDPYHTVDYFASQGIKLDFDKNPDDNLGKKLKKFTHWLRHMKKLGPEDALQAVEDTEAEVQVQKIADSSNTAREIVTEAMAEVLEKQGKKEKAEQLYIKLSFLNPHKSAYFADKIKNLKVS